VGGAEGSQGAADPDADLGYLLKDVMGEALPSVVTDSTCLIGLERIQMLDLLPALFDVLAPPSVAREFGAPLPWLKIRAPRDIQHVATLRMLVDDGEAEALALATEMNCKVILDDLQARKIAARQNIRCLGLLGVLLLAKQAGRVPAIRPLIEGLRAEHFFISEALVAEALRLAGE
jgi:predicted nucleic acid-binding protein